LLPSITPAPLVPPTTDQPVTFTAIFSAWVALNTGTPNDAEKEAVS